MKNLKFTDFCAGIGGGRITLKNLGMTYLDSIKELKQKR